MSMKMSITLAHPAPTPFAQQAGRALHEAGLLHQFATTIAYRPEHPSTQAISAIGKLIQMDLAKQLGRRSISEFPLSLVRSYPMYEWLRLFVSKIDRDQRLTDVVFHWGNDAYDRWVARCGLANVQAVYSYETACWHTFRAAQQRGIARIYDVPAPEHDFVENLLSQENQQYPDLNTPYRQYCVARQPQRTQKRRDEWNLADVVIANSAFTKASYAAAGLDVSKVQVVPYGAPPINPNALSTLPDRQAPIKFLWAGTFSIRKGAHHLLSAWRDLQIGNQAQLQVFGAMTLPRSLVKTLPDTIEISGTVPRTELEQRYQQADMLVFPTLCDGFGMVVTEAFAQGLPVITTDRAGASDLVKHGVNGLIVPAGDSHALAEALEWCITHRSEVQRMRQAALETAASWQWSDYRRLLIESVLDRLTSAGSIP